MNKSNWGGYRLGSGQKPKWRCGKTKPLRIPVSLHEQVIAFAQLLDSAKRVEELLSCEIPSCLDTDTESRIDSVTLSSELRELIREWKKRANRSANPKWYHAKKLLAEIDRLID